MNFSPAEDILPHLAYPDDAARVFNHVYSDAIGAEGGSYQFIDPATHKSRRLRGLTTVLAQLYWPTFTPWAKKKGSGTGSGKGTSTSTGGNTALKRTLQSVAQVTRNKRPRLHGKGVTPLRPPPGDGTIIAPTLTAVAKGHVRGSIMHRQMDELMTLDAESFHRRNPDGEHPWTARLFRALLARGKLPLQSEFRVADLGLGIATRLDMVAVDEKTGELCFLEYKTAGSRELFSVADAGPFARLLADGRLPNSALGRAMIQATIGGIMAARMLGLVDRDFEVTVVLVTEQAIDFIDIEHAFILGTGADLYKDMASEYAGRFEKRV